MILKICFFIFFVYIYYLYKFYKKKKIIYKPNTYNLIAMTSFVMLGFILCLVTSNLGIAFRQKWMVLYHF